MPDALLGEFDVIRLFADLAAPSHPWVRQGIGDDCAVLDLGGERCLLVTKDLLCEGVHFLRGTTTPRQLGWKSLAVNVSDIAAMGGRPLAAFLGLGLDAAEPAFTVGFRDGFLACARAHGIDLLGGDTVRVPRDSVISVTLLGEVARGELVRRAGARAGDAIALGGPVGLSAAGLWLLSAGAQPLDPARRETLVRAHLEPQPQVALGRWIAGRGVATAMIDVSDGLLQDLGHLCAAAGLGARILADALPAPDALAAAAALPGAPTASDWALAGGEDYVLLFTVPPERTAELIEGARRDLGLALTVVGAM